ncbi:MAG: Asp-tRNA(Asn)/Glu-tRNA(Gln) amidotransferase GatCAB subunit C [Legionellales bacterium]|nr:Asp-tRNA(Asn)/Glu-tRNA(Gln) amidotransferase GatCAB subunit C [Legionellales bacterium]
MSTHCNSQLTHEHLRNLEQLAQLKLDENEHEQCFKSLQQILKMFELLDSVDTTSIDHLSIQPQCSIESLRPDTSSTQDHTPTLQQCCPHFNETTQHILVPQVIDSTSDEG